MSILQDHKHAVIDVEGNGQNPPDIIEIAVVHLDDGAIGQVHTWLVRPPKPITPIVTRKVHGISNNDVAACPTWDEIEPQVRTALEGRACVAHNAHVEYEVLQRHLQDWEPDLMLDTLRMAKTTWPDRKGQGGYGLEALLHHANLTDPSTSPQRHRADADATATAHLFTHLAEHHSSYQNLLDAATVPGIRNPNKLQQNPQESLW